MKRIALAIPLLLLLGGLLFAAALWLGSSKDPLTFQSARWDSWDQDQRAQFVSASLENGRLPAGQEVPILQWFFQNDPAAASSALRPFSRSVANLPRHLADTAWVLFQNGQTEPGLAALRTARDLYPNDPDVLGISGVIAFRSGNTEAARTLLDEAIAWGLDRPIVTFHFGGLLVQSDSAADRLRGKRLLLRVLNGTNPDMAERAGLTLLTNTEIPLIPEEVRSVYDRLEEANVFRADNPNLPTQALRIIANRIARHLPEAGLQIADLLVQSPDSTPQDTLGLIRLAQDLRQIETARQWIDSLPEDFPESDPLALVHLSQQFLEGNYPTAIDQLRSMVRQSPPPDGLANAFRSILQPDIPVGTEAQILELYLELPELPYLSALYAVDRLLAIKPLQTDKWLAYATDSLLPKDTLRTGEWFLQKDHPEPLIEAFAQQENLSRDQTLVLLKAYLHLGQAEKAQLRLQQSRDQFDAIIASFFEARILHQLDQPEKAFQAWMDAERGATASERFPLLKQLGFLALEMDQPISALQTLKTAFASGMNFSEREALRLLRLSLDYGTLTETIPVAAYLAENFPTEAVHTNNLAYFNFLAERSIEQSITSMEKLVEDYPGIQAYRLTLALGYLKAGSFNKANRTIESGQFDWKDVGQRGQLIYAAVLAANDQRVLAQGLLQNINSEELIPEERALMPSF